LDIKELKPRNRTSIDSILQDRSPPYAIPCTDIFGNPLNYKLKGILKTPDKIEKKQKPKKIQDENPEDLKVSKISKCLIPHILPMKRSLIESKQ
jgi:hypothetical protein